MRRDRARHVARVDATERLMDRLGGADEHGLGEAREGLEFSA
jgi:hypothetical protein